MGEVKMPVFVTTLDDLIKALRWIQDDERDFILSNRVIVADDVIGIYSDGFLYKKIRWFLKIKESDEYDIPNEKEHT